MTRNAMRRSAAVLFLVFVSLPAIAFDAGVGLAGGLGFWDGPWNDAEETFSDDFGQSTEPLAFPAVSLAFDAAFRPYRFLECGPFLGGGLWGGRMLSSGGSAAERISSVSAWALELGASAGFRYPIGPGLVAADARLGLGFAVVPVAYRNEWKNVSTTQELRSDAGDIAFPFIGLSLGYLFPLGNLYSLKGTLGADIGLANFEGGTDNTVLSRTVLGIRFARSFGADRRNF